LWGFSPIDRTAEGNDRKSFDAAAPANEDKVGKNS
jgi:hypothetical protein